MNNEQILKKAIEKAVGNGYKSYYGEPKKDIHFLINDWEKPELFTLIFSHLFAKAFWGEKYYCCYTHDNCSADIPDYHCPVCNRLMKLQWKVYLQQMVLEEEPLKYLEKFL